MVTYNNHGLAVSQGSGGRPISTLGEHMLRLNTTSTEAHATIDSDLPTPLGPAPLPQRAPVLDGFLRRNELAAQLGLSPRTIDRWHALRQGPPRVRLGRTVFYSINSVREWLRTKEQQVTRAHKKAP